MRAACGWRCTARPACTAATRCCGRRGNASSDTPGTCSCCASACATPIPHAEMVDVRSGSARGAVSTAATTNRRWTRSLPPCVTIGFGGMSMGANAAPSDSAIASRATCAGSVATSIASTPTSAGDSANVWAPPNSPASRSSASIARGFGNSPGRVTDPSRDSSAATTITGIAASVVRSRGARCAGPRSMAANSRHRWRATGNDGAVARASASA